MSREIPRNVELLIKKAAVDPAFKDILLEKRAGAAATIGLKLTPAEEAMLAAVPSAHLEGIIAHTRISPKLKPVFLGYAAGAMLAALGTAITVCTAVRSKTKDEPSEIYRLYEPGIGSMRKIRLPSAGILSDRPKWYREGRAVYVGGDAAGVETRRLEDIEYRLLPLFEYAEEEYDTLIQDEEAEPHGNILVKFVITADGKVEYAEIISNNTGFPELGVRTVQLLKSKRFAPVKEGNATVVYLLRLNVTKPSPAGLIPLLFILDNAEGKYPSNTEGLYEWVRDEASDSFESHTSGITGIRPNGAAGLKTNSLSYKPHVNICPPSVGGNSGSYPRRSPNFVERITRDNLKSLNDLYVDLHKKNPRLGGGEIVVRYIIKANGRVDDASVVKDTLNHFELSAAVLSGIMSCNFSETDGDSVTAIQTFVFSDGSYQAD